MYNCPLSILTYNVSVGHPEHWFQGKHSLIHSYRLDAQLEAIKKLNPDIFCLQEIHCNQLLNQYRNYFSHYTCFYQRDILSPIRLILYLFVALLSYLIIHLQMPCKYTFTFLSLFGYSCYYFLFSTAGGSFINGDIKTSNVIFYKHNKLDFITGKVYYFNNQDGDILNNIRKRGYVHLQLKYQGNLIHIINCHLSNKQIDFSPQTTLDSDINRFEQIIELIKAAKNTSPIIICGDFNACNNTLEIQYMKRFFNNTMKNSEAYYTWESKNPLTRLYYNVPDHQCDYIFFLNLHCQKSQLVFHTKPYLSDHYGIYSFFNIPGLYNSSSSAKKIPILDNTCHHA